MRMFFWLSVSVAHKRTSLMVVSPIAMVHVSFSTETTSATWNFTHLPASRSNFSRISEYSLIFVVYLAVNVLLV